MPETIGQKSKKRRTAGRTYRPAAFDMEQHADLLRSILDDLRSNQVGRVLRRLSLDELPQLFNVLKGDMSLVGPRPCLKYEMENYQAWHKARFDALPGLTGLWQVSGRNKVTFNEMVRMDIKYLQHWTFLKDLLIILKISRYSLLKDGEIPGFLMRSSHISYTY